MLSCRAHRCQRHWSTLTRSEKEQFEKVRLTQAGPGSMTSSEAGQILFLASGETGDPRPALSLRPHDAGCRSIWQLRIGLLEWGRIPRGRRGVLRPPPSESPHLHGLFLTGSSVTHAYQNFHWPNSCGPHNYKGGGRWVHDNQVGEY